MAVTVTVEGADTYFSTEVLFTEEWDGATPEIKQKALNEAERRLYRYYADIDAYSIDDPSKQIPLTAIYEQALWMLRTETVRQAELGVRSYGVSGVSMTFSGTTDYISAESKRIVAEDLAAKGISYGGGRVSWTVL